MKFPLSAVVLAAGMSALSPALAVDSAPEEKPNIVLILADDLGWGDVGWHGSKIKTPNLDRLYKEGVELDRQYVTPMCSPTRAALLSGRYASRFGVTAAQGLQAFPFGTVTLPELLRSLGYDTALIGKWHLGSTPESGPQHFGFSYSYGCLAGGCGPYNHKYKTGPLSTTWHRDGVFIEESGHVTDLITKEAVQWIGSRGDKPFFLYVPFTAPHVPIKEPKEWLDLYPGLEPPAHREYAACVSHLDSAVAKIVKALDEAGKRDNTIIVFLSDNGAPLKSRNEQPGYPADGYEAGQPGGSNLPLRGEKRLLFEGGIRVPAFVSWPAKLKAGKFTEPIHAVDWAPTFAALAGSPEHPAVKWDGINIWPAIAGRAPFAPRPLYWAGLGFREYAVRDGNWKLIAKADSDVVELYDVVADPSEKNDLAAAEPDRVRHMRSLITRLSAADNDAKVPRADSTADVDE